jgi:hypothetical protein
MLAVYIVLTTAYALFMLIGFFATTKAQGYVDNYDKVMFAYSVVVCSAGVYLLSEVR